ncbi:MAG: endonuclease/exonuclease/phosphatase family protein, partial [Mycobacterium sp.]|nr:endonuclease/exonuclease/phosphatase family protein [Mycobacterium sp.]
MSAAASAAGAAPRFGAPGLGSSDGPSVVRVATYNASLNRPAQGQLLTDLWSGTNAQAKAIAEIVQRNRPDILLLNEFDHVAGGAAVRAFAEKYLKVGQRGQPSIDYPYSFTAPVNTGVPTGRDLNGDGSTTGPDDAYGFGAFPGQYGMVVYSRFPIDTARVRTFQKLLWKDQPGNLIPRDYYGANADILRLSSKSHWDVPIIVRGRTVHLLASHPTPPSFDGEEDRNGKRNYDELRLWADYISGAAYLYDDMGEPAAFPEGERFVVMGDLNADPHDAGAVPGSIGQLLSSPMVADAPFPRSDGGVRAAES